MSRDQKHIEKPWNTVHHFGTSISLPHIIKREVEATNTTIKLSGLNNQNITISLLDLQGRHLGVPYNGKINSDETSIEYNVSHLSSGMYLYSIQFEGEKQTLRFIKQ